MARLIDADKLKAKLQEDHDFLVEAWGGFPNMPREDKVRADELTMCIARVVNAPTIDAVSVVHGEWIEDYNNTYSRRRMKCSVCGKFSGIGGIKSNQLKPYCPNCGARMRGADDE